MPTYKKNFLDKVIFRIDFEEVALQEFDKYHQKIKNIFPDRQQKEAFEGLVNIDFPNGEVQQVKKEITVFSLPSTSGKKRVEISPRWAYIEYDQRSYKDSKELINDVVAVIDSFSDHFGIKLINRVGLRYVNVIDVANGDPLDWSKYISNDLIGQTKFAKASGLPVSRSMGQIVLKQDMADIVYNFGIWNKDYPNEVVRREFILDMDCYTRLPVDSTEHRPSELAKGFNAKIEKLFESSITDNLRTILNK